MSTNQGQGNRGAGGELVGPNILSSPNADTRTLDHRGTTVGTSNVTRSQNTTGQNSTILEWTMPKKFTQVVFSGGKHITRAGLRSVETITGSTADDTSVSLSTNIVPIGGFETVADQPFPVAVAYNTTTSTQYTVTVPDGGYVSNTITLGTDPADGDTVKIWPVFSEGVIQYRGRDAFDNAVGPLDEWGVPAHVFADFEQNKNPTQIHMVGAGRFERDEKLVLKIDGPRQIVWEDADYPDGQYVSEWEQRVDVEV